MITSTCNYEIISNPKYANDFFYTKMSRRKQKFMFETSDIVTRVLYLGDERIITEEEEDIDFKTKDDAYFGIRNMVRSTKEFVNNVQNNSFNSFNLD